MDLAAIVCYVFSNNRGPGVDRCMHTRVSPYVFRINHGAVLLWGDTVAAPCT